ncbi:MAG: prepilin peptidase [Planctomycetota bacterium]|nr:prepilin peptidase [Planctomycetota bacterium]
MDAIETVRAVATTAMGLIVGSFLNVVIWRLPRGENLARPRSACPGCGTMIAWYDNVPVVSWLLLRARCRQCKTRIRVRYPLVELLTGGLFLLAFLAYRGDLVTTGIVAVFLAALVAISFIDLDYRIIPDAISKPGIVVFLAAAPFSALHAVEALAWTRTWVPGGKPALNALLDAGIGAAVGALLILLIRAIGTWILKKEAMGLGDVKLLALIGAVVGPLQAVYALVVACFGGALIGGLLFVVGKRRPMPCAMTVRGSGGDGQGLEATFERVKVLQGDQGDFLVRGAPAASAGTAVRVDLVLPATRILEDEDAQLDLRGHIARVEGEGVARTWVIEITEHTERDADLVSFFAQSYRYIPFGPFLALGGVLGALLPSGVHWFLTAGYPALARSLFGS